MKEVGRVSSGSRLQSLPLEVEPAPSPPQAMQGGRFDLPHELADVLFVMAGLVLLPILLSLLALLVALETIGPIVFEWRRFGRRAGPFTGFGFHSTTRSAEGRPVALAVPNETTGSTFKIVEDSCSTQAGILMQQRSLDESLRQIDDVPRASLRAIDELGGATARRAWVEESATLQEKHLLEALIPIEFPGGSLQLQRTRPPGPWHRLWEGAAAAAACAVFCLSAEVGDPWDRQAPLAPLVAAGVGSGPMRSGPSWPDPNSMGATGLRRGREGSRWLQAKADAIMRGMPLQVPFLDLHSQILPLRNELDAAVRRVIDSRGFILGNDLHAPERELARAELRNTELLSLPLFAELTTAHADVACKVLTQAASVSG